FAPEVGDLSQDFHTYGVLWDTNNITWYLDGQSIGSTPTGDDEHKPMYVILDPMGFGDCGDGWADCPQTNPVSADAQVDYVRVWQFADQNPAKCVGDCTTNALATAAAVKRASIAKGALVTVTGSNGSTSTWNQGTSGNTITAPTATCDAP